MLGIWNRKKPDLNRHWYVLLQDFTQSSTDFYEAVREELRQREVPGLETTEEVFAEGGMLSAKRVYLRMRRERLIFDICAAPFGTSYFFSCRCAEIPWTLRIWELILGAVTAVSLLLLYLQVFGFFWGWMALGMTAAALFLLMCMGRNFINLDDALMQIPFIGPVYELFIRKDETYYRVDTRLMYTDLVDKVARRQMQQFAAAQGVNEITFVEVSVPFPTSGGGGKGPGK